jgi:hypothetical protein
MSQYCYVNYIKRRDDSGINIICCVGWDGVRIADRNAFVSSLTVHWIKSLQILIRAFLILNQFY